MTNERQPMIFFTPTRSNTDTQLPQAGDCVG